MKNTLLCLLFALCLFPIITQAAVTKTLEVEFAYNDPGVQKLLGYRLYKEGTRVCQIANPKAAKITCDISTNTGTFNFAITAYYANGSESPSSASFPFTISSTTSTAPTAVLSSSTSVGKAPLAVSFDGGSSTTSNPPIVSYTWEFGDGSKATGKTTSYSFKTVGTYHTKLTVKDSKGLTSSVTTPIIVTSTSQTNQKPKALIATNTTGGNAPLAVSFDGSKSTDADGSLIQYSWDFGDGSTGSGKTAQHTYTAKGVYTASLQVTDNKGDVATATTRITCNTTLPPSALNIEVGEVSINQNWVRVLFDNKFSQPIVVAGPPTSNENEPVLVRIRKIDQKGFEVRLQEWDYQNQNHAAETFSYIVMEKGTFALNNGTRIEVGSFTGSSSFIKINLQQPYNSTPVILAQVITDNAAAAVTSRISNVNQTSFEYMLQEQEKNSASHPAETIGYIAWEPGKGEIDNIVYETGMTTKSIGDSWKELTFQTKFSELPFFIATMQTAAGVDPAAVRTTNMSITKTQIKIEEEKSKDSEVGHTGEVVGFLAIASKTGGTTPTPTTPPADNSTPPDNGSTIMPWTLHYVDSEETAREDGAAKNALDGDPSTVWHTAYSSSKSSCPHEIQVNLGGTYSISGIRYLPRQGGGINGTVGKYAVYVSTDGKNWGSAVAQGTFAKDTKEKTVNFSAKKAQFLRFVALSEINGGPWTSMAELNIVYK